jgi:hypothetical protein
VLRDIGSDVVHRAIKNTEMDPSLLALTSHRQLTVKFQSSDGKFDGKDHEHRRGMVDQQGRGRREPQIRFPPNVDVKLQIRILAFHKPGVGAWHGVRSLVWKILGVWRRKVK